MSIWSWLFGGDHPYREAGDATRVKFEQVKAKMAEHAVPAVDRKYEAKLKAIREAPWSAMLGDPPPIGKIRPGQIITLPSWPRPHEFEEWLARTAADQPDPDFEAAFDEACAMAPERPEDRLAEIGKSVTIPIDEEMRKSVRADIDRKLRGIDEWLRERGYHPEERAMMYRRSLSVLLPNPVSKPYEGMN